MGEKRRVLVIDDEPSVADALRIILDDSGYECTVTLNGRDGLWEASRKRFDVTIVAIRLPDVHGFEVLSRIRQSYPDNQVVVIASHTAPEVVAEALSLGAISVLAKPFLPSEILNAISAALTKR